MSASRKFIWVSALLLLGLLAFAGLAFLTSRDPSYQGRPLNSWAMQYGTNRWGMGARDVKRMNEAQAAVCAIGTDGIPTLLAWMQARDSVASQKLRSVLPRSWHSRLRLLEWAQLRQAARYGFAALGSDAAPAVPAIMELARTTPDREFRYGAVVALRLIGPASEPAIPMLIECTTNSVESIRHDAYMGLAAIGRQPEVVVPVLVQYLESARATQNQLEMSDAIMELGTFREAAKSAAPLFVSLLDDPNRSVRQQVTNYLPWIAPETAAKVLGKPSP